MYETVIVDNSFLEKANKVILVVGIVRDEPSHRLSVAVSEFLDFFCCIINVSFIVLVDSVIILAYIKINVKVLISTWITVGLLAVGKADSTTYGGGVPLSFVVRFDHRPCTLCR